MMMPRSMRSTTRDASRISERLASLDGGLLQLCLVTFLLAVAASCGPSPEDMARQLADPKLRGEARQELLLAKERAVEPLLAALEDPELISARTEIARIIAGLTLRVDDPRLIAALMHHLSEDPDPKIRADIARLLGLHARIESVPGLLAALADTSGDVRHQAMTALGALNPKLAPEQKDDLGRRAHDLAGDPHAGVRLEAVIRIEDHVSSWLQQARQRTLKAQLAEAESLYAEALSYWPKSRQALYALGSFYHDTGQVERGLQTLREHGMLVDVARLPRAPEMDGRLSESEWSGTAEVDSFYQYTSLHKAALPSEVQSRLRVGYTDEAIYFGFHGHDDNPDSLVATFSDRNAADQYLGGRVTEQQTIWTDDIIELFVDASFDRQMYGHMGINSLGVVADEWIGDPQSGRWNDPAWQPRAEVAAHVGVDYWSLEYRLEFDGKYFPRPQPGTVWGFNVVRVFRGQEYSQWVRTFGGNAHTPDQFGLLVFRP